MKGVEKKGSISTCELEERVFSSWVRLKELQRGEKEGEVSSKCSGA